MAQTRRDEQRLLSADERELVARTHQPGIKELADEALGDLLVRLRDRRDRARDIARQQRREMRGKAAPAGAARATDNTGSKAKGQLLAAAVKRLNKETQRRRTTKARDDLVTSSRRALELKQAADAPERPTSRAADEGMQPIPNPDIAPSGALNAEGHRPVLERSRKVR